MRGFRSDETAYRINRRALQYGTCKRGAEALSDTFCVLLATSNQRAARSRSSPVSNARAGYASRHPRPRWTVETHFSTLELGERPAMTERDEPIAQLATRIPKDLHRRLKLYCVTHEIAVQDFVIQAIQEKLGRKTRPKKGTA